MHTPELSNSGSGENMLLSTHPALGSRLETTQELKYKLFLLLGWGGKTACQRIVLRNVSWRPFPLSCPMIFAAPTFFLLSCAQICHKGVLQSPTPPRYQHPRKRLHPLPSLVSFYVYKQKCNFLNIFFFSKTLLKAIREIPRDLGMAERVLVTEWPLWSRSVRSLLLAPRESLVITTPAWTRCLL